jgi:two-component system heavy metal sensor histidine kinase CusS
MTAPSIRLRLTAWYSLVLLLGLSLFGLGMWLALRTRLVAGVDTRLAQRIRGVASAGGEMTDRKRVQRELSEFASEIPDTLIQLRDPSGEVIVPFSDQQPFAGRAPIRRTIEREGKPFRVLAARIELGGRPYEALVAGSLEEVDAVMRDFRNLLLLMIPGVLAAASLGGYWLSMRALRPVDEITSVAKSISVQNLSQRLAVPHTGDELQRMAETWNEVLERLESSVKRIRQFTADASHELRTPIALIRATAELALRRERAPEHYRNALRSIEIEAEQMTALAESLLLMARADSNGFQMALAPTDLNAIVSRVIGQHQALAAEKGIRLQTDSAGVPTLAQADEPAIHRLLLILIDNALKHTPAGGTVTLAARQSDGGVLLSVSDTGEGIPPDALPHIFERFYRSDPARAGRGGSGAGFGLGLSIAQAIAQAHGARIRVESSLGAGAQFLVELKSPFTEISG